ncbi:Ig-like domain-containing protein [Paenibacillus sp. N3.4]|uniref:Ig-like domain-containing protein n=1 Tax=Paenibacillus sp. N3.4 TaxID=2603222 RepID=UPI0011C7E6C3|nr:Ig-like domain-containing protein [Paenibacillus sp. N3.4]TXK70054.1 Ig-like domain repeat protein [Paenibacillus sp. N3.4]
MRDDVRMTRSLRWVSAVIICLLVMSVGQPYASAISPTVPTKSTLNGSVQSVYGDTVQLTTVVTDETANYNVPSGTVSFYDGTALLGTQTLAENLPVIVNKQNTSAPSVAGSYPLCESCNNNYPTIEWGGLTYWAFTYSDNRNNTKIVAVDANNNVVRQWDDVGDVRYVGELSLDNVNRKVIFKGQFNGATNQFTLDWSYFSNANAKASMLLSTLAPGKHEITAVYQGDGLHIGSTSAQLTHQVAKIGSSTVLTSNAPSVHFGENVTYTANVVSEVPGRPVPSGTVTFKNGFETLGTVNVDGSGTAKFTQINLLVSNLMISAEYSGDELYLPSISNSLSQVLLKIPTTTALTASPVTSQYGEAINLTATVTNQLASSYLPNGGNADFMENGTKLGEATVVNGIASMTISSLAVGTHALMVIYNAGTVDFQHGNSESGILNVEVGKLSTTTTATSNSIVYGQAARISAKVTTTTDVIPLGEVVFRVDGTATGSPVALDKAGEAIFNMTNLAVGDHPVTVEYRGNANFAGSISAMVNQQVKQSAIQLLLTSNTNEAEFGQAVNLSANAAAPEGMPVPTGNVKLQVDQNNNLTLPLVDGQLVWSTSSLDVGAHTIVAQYLGNDHYAEAYSQPIQISITSIPTKVELFPSVTGAVYYGTPITYKAVVSNKSESKLKPTGQIAFQLLGQVPVLVNLDEEGVALITTSTLPVGVDLIAVNYVPDHSWHAVSHATYTQIVQAAAPGPVLTLDQPNPVYSYGNTVAFSVYGGVQIQGQSPTGTVHLIENGAELAEATLGVDGYARFALNGLSSGTHQIIARYSGDTFFHPADTQPISLMVKPVLSSLILNDNADSQELSVAQGLKTAVVHLANLVTLKALNAEESLRVELIPINATTGQLGAPIALANGSTVSPVALADGLNRYLLRATSFDGTVATTYSFSLLHAANGGRWNLAESMKLILAEYDIDGNGVFNRGDVIELLSQIQPISATRP